MNIIRFKFLRSFWKVNEGLNEVNLNYDILMNCLAQTLDAVYSEFC